MMYRTGQGADANLDKAFKWYRLAADQGHASAQYELGVMHQNGEGTICKMKSASAPTPDANCLAHNPGRPEISHLSAARDRNKNSIDRAV